MSFWRRIQQRVERWLTPGVSPADSKAEQIDELHQRAEQAVRNFEREIRLSKARRYS